MITVTRHEPAYRNFGYRWLSRDDWSIYDERFAYERSELTCGGGRFAIITSAERPTDESDQSRNEIRFHSYKPYGSRYFYKLYVMCPNRRLFNEETKPIE